MKQKVVLVLAVLIGVVAFFLTKKYIADEKARLYAGAERIKIIAAGRDLPSGRVLSADDLVVRPEFKTAVGDNVYRPDDQDVVIGRKLLLPLKRFEPLTAFHLETTPGARRGLAAAISRAGMRAVSISVGGATAVSGLVRPNDRVDILGTFSFPARAAAAGQAPGQNETVTLTLLQDVTILAVGTQMATDYGMVRGVSASGYSTVTLEVTPREAEVLVFAQHAKGQLCLTLRKPDDGSFEKDLPEVDFRSIEKDLPALNDYRQRQIWRKPPSP